MIFAGTASKRVVLKLFTCSPEYVIKSQHPWNQSFCSLKWLLPCYTLRCRRLSPFSISHTSDSRHGLASIASDLHNLSFWNHYCYLSFLWWKANISTFPQKLLSDGRNKSQENFLHRSCWSQLLCGIQRIPFSVAQQQKLFDPNAMAVWKVNYRIISSFSAVWFIFL